MEETNKSGDLIPDNEKNSGKDNGSHFKHFKLSTAAINNKTTVFVIAFIILFGGMFSYQSMPKEAFPEVNVPEIYVGTAYPGNSAEDIEKLITRPLEKEINLISEVDEINSTSAEGFSSIQVKFTFDVDPSEALQKVKDKVDIAKSDADFPTDLPADPNVFELNFSEMVPVMIINLSGDYPLDELKEYAELLQEDIEEVEQISEVEIRGVMDKEMRIALNPLRMEAMNVSFNDVASAIQSENTTISGGNLLTDGYRRSVRVIGEYKNAEQIENTVVKSERQELVYLKDIGEVTFQEEEKESYAREYLKPVVSLDVKKKAGENLLYASDRINEILEEAKKDDLPKNLNISITNDMSDDTRTQVSELENSIIFGMLLVVGVLMFFLGLRNALFVGIAIPMSMFMSFMILNSMGVTLNTMVLFSLVLALGMLVDNGIVVVENIYRLMDEGYSRKVAAMKGVAEVAWPIIASTATTLAAFTPLAIWPGIFGEFMKFLPITLIIVLGSSLFVGLVINPVLTAVFMRVDEEKINRKKVNVTAAIMIVLGLIIALSGVYWLGNLFIFGGLVYLMQIYVFSPGGEFFQKRVIPWLESYYEKFLTFAVSGAKPYLFFGGTFLMLILAGFLFWAFPPKVLFFPENEPQYINVFIEMPEGTDIERTNDVAREIEEIVIDELTSEEFTAEDPRTGEVGPYLVTSVIGQVGEGTSDPMQGPSTGQTPNKAKVTAQFVRSQFRGDLTTSDAQSSVRERLRGYPGVEISVDKNQAGPPTGAPINIEVSADDYDTLLFYAERMKQYINSKNIGGIEELKLDVNKNKPEMPISIDRTRARRYGLSTAQIGDAIRTGLFGKEVSRFKDGEDDYPINIRYMDEYRYDPNIMLDQRITFRDPADGKIKQVPISSVANANRGSTFNAVKRKDLDRVITISSNVLDGYNPTEVNQNIEDALENFEKPGAISYNFTGEQEEQAKELEFLSVALVIAVFLIFLIIVAQFNSTSTPLIIIFSVIFSLIGVLLGLIIFRMEFVIIMTMVGIIALAGVVVNNAIVLIDYTDLIRERMKRELDLGEDDKLPFPKVVEAVIEGGKVRLRPVLLTAITTVLGLVPLAIGLNINFITLFTEYDTQFYIGGDNVMFWGPMSWTIIFGLTFATFLTLVIVPVMYLLLNKFKFRVIYKKTTD
jgi:multidrug efflux pump subunit AcrB